MKAREIQLLGLMIAASSSLNFLTSFLSYPMSIIIVALFGGYVSKSVNLFLWVWMILEEVRIFIIGYQWLAAIYIEAGYSSLVFFIFTFGFYLVIGFFQVWILARAFKKVRLYERLSFLQVSEQEENKC